MLRTRKNNNKCKLKLVGRPGGKYQKGDPYVDGSITYNDSK
jgi:hypothetical protein